MAWYAGLIIGIIAGVIGIPWAIDTWILPEPKIRPWILRCFFRRVEKGPSAIPSPSLSRNPSGGSESTQPILLQIPPPSSGSSRVDVRLTIEYLDGLPNAKPKIKDPFEEGLEHKKKYEYDQAIKSFRYALAKEPTGSQKAALLLLIGNCFAEQSKFAEAEGHYKEAAAAAIEANDQAGLAATYNNIGAIYQYKGDYDRALEWLQKSLKIKEQIGDQAGLATTYNNIGLIYKSKGEYDKALEWYQKSLKIKEQIGDRAGLATTYNNIELIYKSKGEYDRALEWYQKSLKITEQIGAKDKIEIVRRNIEGLKAQGQKK